MTTITTTAPAWHGDQTLKGEVMQRLREHRAADAIIQGVYQELAPDLAVEYRGCAIGCTLPKQDKDDDDDGYGLAEPNIGWHAEVERLYGIPTAVAHLIDRIFEGLPTSEAGDFAVAVIDAVPVGADLSMVSSRLMLDILADDERGVLRLTEPGTRRRDAVETVTALYRRRLARDEPTRDDWIAARSVAVAVAAAVAVAVAAVAADADAAAVAAAAAYAAAAAARKQERQWQAHRFLEYLNGKAP